MIRHSTKIAVEIVVGALVMAFVLVLGLVWRLSEGPIQLTPLAPYLEEALSDPERGLEARILDLSVAWDEDLRRPELRTFGISILDQDGVAVLDLPRADLRLSLPALLQGRLAAEQIDIVGIGLELERARDGGIDLASARPVSGDPVSPESDLGDLGDVSLDDWLAADQEGEGATVFAFLQRVRIIGGRVSLRDLASGDTWRAPQAFIDLRRTESGVLALLDLKLEIGGELTDLDAEATYDRFSGLIDARLSFAGVHPRRAAEALPFSELRQLEALDLTLSGDLVLSVTDRGVITQAGLEVTGSPGRLDPPGLNLDPLPLRGLRLEAGLDLMQASMKLRRLELMLGEEAGPAVLLAGELRGLSGDLFGRQQRDLTAELTFGLKDVAVEDLSRYWPPDMAGNGRKWVLENITAGWVESLDGSVAVTAPRGRWDDLQLRALEGSFAFSGVEAHYLRPMPHLEGLDGVASFDASSLLFSVDGGTVGAIQVGAGNVELYGLDGRDHRLRTEFSASGSLPEVFGLLNHPRISLIDKLGLEMAGSAGQVAATASFDFPLIADLDFEQIEVKAGGDLTDVALKGALLGQDVTDGGVRLDLDKAGMGISGNAAFAGVPLSFSWRENFVPIKGLLRSLEASVPAAGHEKLAEIFGIRSAPYLAGPLAVNLKYSEEASGAARVEAAANLTSAAMSIPELADWSKPAGVEGRAVFALLLQDGVPQGLQAVEVTAGSLQLSGQARFDAAGRQIASAALSTFAFDEQALWDVTLQVKPDGLAIDAGGGILDARPFLEEEEGQETSGGEVSPAADRKSLRVTVRNLEQLRFADERYLEEGHLDLEREAKGWRWVVLRGRIPEALRSAAAKREESSPGVELSYGPTADGKQVLSVETRDAGGLFRSLDLFDTMEGGWLRINGARDGVAPANPLRGRLEIKDFKLVKAPLLARLLTVASLTGIVDLLSGDGIEFAKAITDFEAVEGRISTELLRIYGPALGLTAQGHIDIDKNEADLRGTVVPAYSVNQVLGAIPLLGNLLTGGEGEGVFAVTYGISGSLDEPKVTVNPLAALAPGFLRGLFDVGDQASESDRPRALPGPVDR